jgi:hypothetical protein
MRSGAHGAGASGSRVAGRIFSYYTASVLRVHKSALKHGCTVEGISHALDMAMYWDILDEDNDPPKQLIIGPDGAANILELIGGELADDVLLIWHAKRCRAEYLTLLPKAGGDT